MHVANAKIQRLTVTECKERKVTLHLGIYRDHWYLAVAIIHLLFQCRDAIISSDKYILLPG